VSCQIMSRAVTTSPVAGCPGGCVMNDKGRLSAPLVLAGTAEGRQSDRDITVFDSTALAIQDLAIALTALERADDLNLRCSTFRSASPSSNSANRAKCWEQIETTGTPGSRVSASRTDSRSPCALTLAPA
jgi:hypothetical protein